MRDLRHLPARQEQEELRRTGARGATRGRRILAVALSLALASLAIASDVTLCPVAALSGVPCPGCGLTRAALALISGDFTAAFALHPLVFVAAPLVALLGLGLLRDVWRGESAPASVPPRAAGWVAAAAAVLLAAFISVWFARLYGAFGGPVPVHPWFSTRHTLNRKCMTSPSLTT